MILTKQEPLKQNCNYNRNARNSHWATPKCEAFFPEPLCARDKKGLLCSDLPAHKFLKFTNMKQHLEHCPVLKNPHFGSSGFLVFLANHESTGKAAFSEFVFSVPCPKSPQNWYFFQHQTKLWLSPKSTMTCSKESPTENRVPCFCGSHKIFLQIVWFLFQTEHACPKGAKLETKAVS